MSRGRHYPRLVVNLIVIELLPIEIARARQLAELTHAKYADRPGHYRNLLSSHLVGRIGEIAALEYLARRRLDPVPYFHQLDMDSSCDIDTAAGRCEVKTWSWEHWESWGRAIAAGQLPSLQQKADFILWCALKDPDGRARVRIMGWSMVADITGSPEWMGPAEHQILNYQLKESELRDLDSLIDLRSTSYSSSSSSR